MSATPFSRTEIYDNSYGLQAGIGSSTAIQGSLLMLLVLSYELCFTLGLRVPRNCLGGAFNPALLTYQVYYLEPLTSIEMKSI